ncbi:hypothetical protein GCM10015535_58470 [Streptomyces gelaticus]|uniref:Uncharacterized protein n=1 Tax=Streptomyces gelaticus TaxID=285446 RepID=A0ABQ2W6A5_9ACTN|nr:hypothetical protein GCM10015535_58470 [Streptomyces gelaticus]
MNGGFEHADRSGAEVDGSLGGQGDAAEHTAHAALLGIRQRHDRGKLPWSVHGGQRSTSAGVSSRWRLGRLGSRLLQRRAVRRREDQTGFGTAEMGQGEALVERYSQPPE